MKRQLLKRTVKLIQIVHHTIVLPREKENMQSDHFPQFSRGGGGVLKLNTFASSLGKYEIRSQNDKYVLEINIQVFCLIDPFNFVPALTLHSGFI